MTIRQERLVKLLQENKTLTVQKAAVMAGYSEGASRTRIYDDIRKGKLREALERSWSAESVRREIDQAKRHFKKKDDGSNWSRMLELKAKILKMTQEQATQAVTVFNNKDLGDLPKQSEVTIMPLPQQPEEAKPPEVIESKEDTPNGCS